MSLYPRDPNASPSSSGYPIARTYAGVVLVALVILIALRHLFGSVRVEAGVR